MRRLFCLLSFLPLSPARAQNAPPQIEQSCIECHDAETKKGGLDLTALKFDLADSATRERWVRVFDRVEKGEMPPKSGDMAAEDRAALVKVLDASLYEADRAEVLAQGRGPLRRLIPRRPQS